MQKRARKQISILLKTGLYMLAGILLFKYTPMYIFGSDILFDASMHITTAIFILYTLWFFVDQNKKMHIPFFVISAVILSVISLQRIEANAHNDIGLMGGIIISVLSIYFANPKLLQNKFKF